MKQQTAVEWLNIRVEWMQNRCKTEWECGYQKAVNEVLILIKQAKQMEKEQIITAFNEGTFSEMEKINSEQYYKETYKL